ncbi:hypothetical protein BGW36DRAFT_447603 [Talaromyces proteolyticus]|uniref:Uncharacterized protein n=1 Tax=Talaromyces proteolyticus TaxID=1131652 RepID=A0AAD4Q2W2_9EURO|nr:uncharacterized protein BGW36DRAFT_447603 [Talaromyces proteolyticus]KAH8700791.1 hypothetical protein BGW36DRAFT_447603 [Talaromyces proteolyticus]
MIDGSTFSSHISALRSLIHGRRLRLNRGNDGQISLSDNLSDVSFRAWDIGFTAFSGRYQELFAICQALPGPGSTKMLFCLILSRAGFILVVAVFYMEVKRISLMSLPGARGMYTLSFGVQHISDILLSPVYSLLFGFNSSTVGIIALAAVQLAEKAIRDKLPRILAIFGACAAMCYNTLWYFPLLMVIGGLATVIWDGWMSQRIRILKAKLKQRRSILDYTTKKCDCCRNPSLENPQTPPERSSDQDQQQYQHQASSDHAIRVQVGIAIVVLFFASYIGVLVGCSVKLTPALALDLFANTYLAGTIIFGGGPIVIPLLRSYILGPELVSSPQLQVRGVPWCAFLQSIPFPTIFGSLLGFLGILLPGIALTVAVQSFWRALRNKWVNDLLRGVNATAVGLYLTSQDASGQSLGRDP